MKSNLTKILSILSICMTVALAAQAQVSSLVSAQATQGVLTILFAGDTCNYYYPSLEIEPLCRVGRITTNFADVCEAKLLVRQTKMACEPGTLMRQFELDLKAAGLTPEAQTLILSYGEQKLTIDLSNP